MKFPGVLLISLIASQAQAFPIILGGAGAFAMGTAFIPLILAALIFFIVAWLWRLPKQALVAIAISALMGSGLLWNQWAAENREAILTNTQSLGAPAQRTTDIPYPYVSLSDQKLSSSRMSAEDFYEQLSKRAIRVIRVDLEPQLFKDFGFGATASQIHDDPAPIVAMAKKGLNLVLVDERGTTAAAIADSINAKNGTHIRFLEGGANGLSDFAWDHLAVDGDDHAVSPADIPSFKKVRKPEILSTTNPDEFLNYGWMHGLTVSLPVFLAGADAIASRFEGVTVLITAAESHFSGDTWILLDMLRARGVDAYFMEPTRDELLVKPAYFNQYKNADRYISADETFNYVVGTDQVRFLDFQSAIDWSRNKNPLPRTDHIDMEIVAKGGLADALAKLDRSKRYVGLAYDRRTFYHSILAGELLSAAGVTWVGIDTQPELFNRAVLSDQDLIDPSKAWIAQIEYHSIETAGALLDVLPGSKLWVLWLNFLVCFTGAIFATQVRRQGFKILVFIISTLASYFLMLAYTEVSRTWVSDNLLTTAQIVGAFLGWLIVQFSRASRRFRRDHAASVLPDKISLLERAAIFGIRVERGVVVSDRSQVALPKWALESPVMVRSAALSESSTAHTVGIYASIPAIGERAVREAILTIQSQIRDAGEVPCCLVQPLIEGQTFGVSMFGSGTDGHLFICESGEGDAVTAGVGPTNRIAVPVWKTRGLDPIAKKTRAVLLDLYREMGATTIEWALSSRGTFTLLQVSVDTLGRPGLDRLLKSETRRFLPRPNYVPLPARHDTSTGGAVIAAMAAPGDQVCVSGVRFARQRTFLEARVLQLADIVRVLGTLPCSAITRVPGQKLLTAFIRADAKRRAHRETVELKVSAPTEALAMAVAGEIRQVAELYGRFSRIATTAIEMDIESEAVNFNWPLQSTILGAEIAPLSPSALTAYAAEHGYSAVTAFTPTQAPCLDPELISPVIQNVDSPLAWIKDHCAVTMMLELGRLRPAINALFERGQSNTLLSLLPAYVGESLEINPADCPQTVRQILRGDPPAPGTRKAIVWGIPAKGMKLTLTSPERFSPGNALYLETADMRHLANLPHAGAIIVGAGSSLSHLLQHARRLKIPHVVGFEMVEELLGTQVNITASGEVQGA